MRVWLDEHELTVGDSLSEKIDEGLSQSRFGTVILSPAFFAKHWPKRELAGLRAKEEEGQKVILPIWHNIDKATVRQFSPILADVLAASTEQGIEGVAEKLLNVIFAPRSDSPSRENPSLARRLIEILESHPDKTTFLDFIRFHWWRTRRYLSWGRGLIFEKYEFDGVEFDAYEPYIGHGASLTLVSFTEIWADPFEINQEESTPKICDKIKTTISRVRLIQMWFGFDEQLQASLINRLAKEDKYFSLCFPGNLEDYNPDYLKFIGMPDLQFFIFAGRRSKIDTNRVTHDTWSRLLKENKNITIKTYDYILDAFLDHGGDKI